MANRIVDLIGGIRKRYASSMEGLLKAYQGSNWGGDIDVQPQTILSRKALMCILIRTKILMFISFHEHVSWGKQTIRFGSSRIKKELRCASSFFFLISHLVFDVAKDLVTT
ncbi:hypothetical protein R3W88_013523 [Solanum pinnatisectum]|uniref:Uncharacterized protein n=1 Tax=Solanum pinnatisectum TaxID=50273 RepID=A0AAV9KRC2_9SOLN|nr:hypothetical protein R3W88_013523 [Solanum pinnatisectum]